MHLIVDLFLPTICGDHICFGHSLPSVSKYGPKRDHAAAQGFRNHEPHYKEVSYC